MRQEQSYWLSKQVCNHNITVIKTILYWCKSRQMDQRNAAFLPELMDTSYLVRKWSGEEKGPGFENQTDSGLSSQPVRDTCAICSQSVFVSCDSCQNETGKVMQSVCKVIRIGSQPSECSGEGHY